MLNQQGVNGNSTCLAAFRVATQASTPRLITPSVAPGLQGRARRLSAPPAIGGTGSFTGCNGAAPLERQLQFVSGSHEAGLPAVPEGEQEGEAHTEGAAPQSVPPPPREGAVTVGAALRTLTLRHSCSKKCAQGRRERRVAGGAHMGWAANILDFCQR